MSTNSNPPAKKAEKAEKAGKTEKAEKAEKAEKPEKSLTAEHADQSSTKTADQPAAAESGDAETAKDPAKGYTRGEGQKPVSPRYRSNWDNIFGKKR